MARFRKIDPRIWNDAKFAGLSSEAKLLFLYLLTSPAMTILGALPIRASVVAEELGLDPKRYAIRYEELSQQGMVEYDDRGLFWVKNYLKYNGPDNPKVVISWASALDLLPECSLLESVLEAARNHCLARGESFAKAFEDSIGNRYANGMAYGMPYKEKEKEKEQEQENKEKVEKEAKKAKREPTVSFPDTLPAEWSQAALSIRQDVTPERVFLKLRGRYAPTTTKKTVGNWRKIFLGWIGRESPETGKTSGKAPLPPHKDPAFHFGKEYYDKSVNPDGTTNWGV